MCLLVNIALHRYVVVMGDVTLVGYRRYSKKKFKARAAF